MILDSAIAILDFTSNPANLDNSIFVSKIWPDKILVTPNSLLNSFWDSRRAFALANTLLECTDIIENSLFMARAASLEIPNSLPIFVILSSSASESSKSFPKPSTIPAINPPNIGIFPTMLEIPEVNLPITWSPDMVIKSPKAFAVPLASLPARSEAFFNAKIIKTPVTLNPPPIDAITKLNFWKTVKPLPVVSIRSLDVDTISP